MTELGLHAVKRAIVSVSDKTGLAGFAQGLASQGIQIYSTGGTGRFLASEGIAVTDIADYTAFPEMMEGRLKTLHPKVFGGILARPDRPGDAASLRDHQMTTFELVVVNLYPFEATVARGGVTDAEIIEQIDIGGPSLIRAAAKNHRFAAVVTDASQFAEVLDQIQVEGGTTLALRRRLAASAFAHTADYDRVIADYFARCPDSPFGQRWSIVGQRKSVLRYGENPHQRAALFQDSRSAPDALVRARQRHGKELSYNNYLDLDAAVRLVRGLPQPAACVIKHNNPCGAAHARSLAVAMEQALAGDPLSAFGGVVGVNRPVDAETAHVLTRPDQFIEAVVAPSFHEEALHVLTTVPKWKTSVRLMELGALTPAAPSWGVRPIDGGFLVQDADVLADPESEWNVVTQRSPDAEQWEELRFAWHVVRQVRSNAIVVTRDAMLRGAGAGQMSRVDSVEIALRKAGDASRGAVLASDAFFPFPDSIQLAADAGITAVIQPGGSRNDEQVVAACNQRGLAMVFTGRRHFSH